MVIVLYNVKHQTWWPCKNFCLCYGLPPVIEPLVSKFGMKRDDKHIESWKMLQPHYWCCSL